MRRNKNACLPTIERLRHFFNYNPITGIMVRKNRPFRSRIKVGDLVGHVEVGGYLITSVDGRKIHVHRIAFALMQGFWAQGEIDHKNTKRLHNQWCNLREATHQEQAFNRKPKRELISKGVWQTPSGRFAARITKDGIQMHIGVYNTEDQASEAYATAALKAFGKFARSV